MNNPNHPKKGDCIKVEPIRSEKDIKNIKKLLADKPRDFCLFNFGVNVPIRAGDLLKIKVGQVRYVQPGEYFTIREQKTGKTRNITINKTVHAAVNGLIRSLGKDVNDDDYLFQSRKGKGKLTVPTLNALVKSWGKAINLKCNLGSHSLRKSVAWVHYKIFGTDIPTLMTMFNHSSQKQTLTYLGIQEADVQNAYMKEI